MSWAGLRMDKESRFVYPFTFPVDHSPPAETRQASCSNSKALKVVSRYSLLHFAEALLRCQSSVCLIPNGYNGHPK